MLHSTNHIEKCRFKFNISIFIEISIVVDWVGVFIRFRVLMWLGSLSVCMWQYLVISWRHKLVYTLGQWKWPFEKVWGDVHFSLFFHFKKTKSILPAFCVDSYVELWNCFKHAPCLFSRINKTLNWFPSILRCLSFEE